MKTKFLGLILGAIVYLPLSLFLIGCGQTKPDPKAEAPPPASVEPDLDANNFKVAHPEQFPLVTAVEYKAVPALNVTGPSSPI
jgi:cobalt-zinc-cadmium efflux system membrane fusion protein